MAGHSKWAQIKRKKGAADQKRGTLFTKLGHKITIAAREGGGDPSMNFTLRLAIDTAKQANMPKDNIDRAIKRGSGELEGSQVEEMIYEGFGQEGAAFLVETLTDNKNRTASEVRSTFSKSGGSLGASNSVQWMFEKQGVIRIEKQEVKDQDEFELLAIDAGAVDIQIEDEGISVITKPENLHSVKDEIVKVTKIASAEIEFVPKDPLKIESKDREEKLNNLLEKLEELDDVVSVHTNF